MLYLNATDLKLGNSTYFVQLFSFLVFTKCQVLNLRVCRSCDQVLQRAHSYNSFCFGVRSLVWDYCHQYDPGATFVYTRNVIKFDMLLGKFTFR